MSESLKCLTKGIEEISKFKEQKKKLEEALRKMRENTIQGDELRSLSSEICLTEIKPYLGQLNKLEETVIAFKKSIPVKEKLIRSIKDENYALLQPALLSHVLDNTPIGSMISKIDSAKFYSDLHKDEINEENFIHFENVLREDKLKK